MLLCSEDGCTVLGKTHAVLVLFGEERFFQRPDDAQLRIVPAQAGFCFRMIVFRAFVMKVGKIAENGKAVRKTGSDPELMLVVGGEFRSVPASEGGRTGTDIHGHVKDIAEGNADKLALGKSRLVMQTSQYAAP